MEFIKKIFKILDESLKDNATGLYSHSRIIAMLVAFGATVFMWKLIIMGGMSIEYFLGYLAYGTGHQSINKFLDNRDPQRISPVVTPVVAPVAKVTAAKATKEVLEIPKPPRE